MIARQLFSEAVCVFCFFELICVEHWGSFCDLQAAAITPACDCLLLYLPGYAIFRRHSDPSEQRIGIMDRTVLGTENRDYGPIRRPGRTEQAEQAGRTGRLCAWAVYQLIPRVPPFYQARRIGTFPPTRLATPRGGWRIDTVEWFLAGIVCPDIEFELPDRCARSRTGCETSDAIMSY